MGAARKSKTPQERSDEELGARPMESGVYSGCG